MPVSFRCTGCRARLHVPARWSGGTVPCPKCRTRVVVPQVAGAGPAPHPATAFESRAVERSLAALEPAAGGSFAVAGFELPAGDPDIIAETPAPGVTLPWWVVYAGLLGLAGVAAGSFFLGIWWAGRAAEQ